MYKLFNKKLLLLLAFLAVLTSSLTVFAQSNREIFIVGDKMVSCRGTVKEDCLQVKRLPEERFSIFRDRIENFRYIAGYYYVLDVQKISGARNSANVRYRLKRILARVRSEEDQSQDQPMFFGTRWKLTHVDGKAVSNDRAFIRFDEQKKSAGGNGGCNVFGGSLSTTGNRIRISGVISTKMFCEDGSDVENRYFSALERVTEYEIRDGKLILRAGKIVVLEFEAE